jgi:hypothetical protein
MKAKDSWKPVTIGGLTGIMMGAGAMYAIQPKPAHDEEDLSGAESDTADYAHSDVVAANDALSFSEAFAEAREASGPGGLFTWRGNLYGTYYADEWNAMSDEEKDAFASKAQLKVESEDSADTSLAENAQVESVSIEEDVQIAEDSHTEETPVETAEDVTVASEVSWDDIAQEDNDVRVIGYKEFEVGDGQSVVMQELDVNGQRVAVIDVDKDGIADLGMSDLNHNYQMDDGEVIDLETGEAVIFTNDEPVESTCGEIPADDASSMDFGMI